MKTVPILLSLAMGAATAQIPEGEATRSSIRASKLVVDKTKRGAATESSAASSSTSTQEERPTSRAAQARGHDHAARDKRSQHKEKGNALHKKLLNSERILKESSSAKNTDDAKKTNSKNTQEDRDLKKATNAEDKTKTTGEKGKANGEEERELKKTKSDKGGSGGGGGWEPSWGDDRRGDDDYRRGDDDRFDFGPGGGGGGGGGWDPSWGSSKSDKSSGDPGWGWGGSGKSGKSDGGGGGWDPSWGSGKSGKSGGGGFGKSGKSGGGGGGWDPSWGSGKSGKAGWAGGDWGGDWSGGGWCGDYAWVTVTNLSFRQSFSEIFIMTATPEVTWLKPIYVFGERANNALARLAQDADTIEMENRYLNRYGVEQVKTFRSFTTGSFTDTFLSGGSRAKIKVRTSGLGHRLSIAAGLPFTNDGAVVIQGEPIYDGAEYLVPAIDAGVEGNIQTCWSVAAMQNDFPFASECADETKSDLNDNDVPGESFVHMHRGMNDLDNQNDLKDILFFPTCKDLDLDNNNNNDRFVEYFYQVGFDDDLLLCRNFGANCDPRDDQDFLDYLDSQDDLTDDRYVELAMDSADFDDFCDMIDNANKDIDDLFTVLEPWLFDWRNEMMHVEIECGWDDDGWHGDDFHADGWDGSSSSSSSHDNVRFPRS
eukprot:CAMPEP_0172303856 /NCGR_PEP_ID=MMETSP1058-20130122/5367_1 /TAXON_ID=83371 /ORGANISM="Detonula confervacea, Strain CCMP 353" /LENGTH=652 /DNA_ID=CAMNT_0013014887 /DNA_START=96 /DNA_END=2054 /DNA_ORIENTATION=+